MKVMKCKHCSIKVPKSEWKEHKISDAHLAKKYGFDPVCTEEICKLTGEHSDCPVAYLEVIKENM